LKAYSRPIYFSRHGESIYNTKELIGGDSELSEKGKKYGECLRKFFKEQKEDIENINKY
jgi:broad specificity phosphatase PhoE